MKVLALICLQGTLLGLLLFHSSNAAGVDCPTGTEYGCPNVLCPDHGPFECPLGYPDDLYRNPNDCCTFYKCVANNFYCYDCPDDLVYDERTKECHYHYEVPECNGVTYCADVTLRPTNVTTTSPTVQTERTTQPATTQSTTTQPTTTRSTTTEPTTTRSTTTTQSTTTQSTTTRSTTTASTTPTTTSTPTTASTTTAKPTITRPDGGFFVCPDDQPNGFFPITPDTCNHEYYACVDGVPSILECPVDSVFDPELLICVPPEEATCAFTCPTANGFYPIPGQCTGLHYICVEFVAYTQQCPGTSIFDPEQRICLSSSNPDLSCTPEEPFACPYSPGRFAHPESCSLYYICSERDGFWILSQCPSDNVFNPATESCEQPKGQVSGCNSFSLMDYQEDSRLVGMSGGPAKHIKKVHKN